MFYEKLFKETAGLSWPAVCETAATFEPKLQAEWPQYCEEMKGKLLARGYHHLLFDLQAHKDPTFPSILSFAISTIPRVV